MSTALQVERPVRTRSDLADVPIIGPLFQYYCDLADLININTQFLKRYLVFIPVAFAVPGTVAGIKALMATKTLARGAATAAVGLR